VVKYSTLDVPIVTIRLSSVFRVKLRKKSERTELFIELTKVKNGPTSVSSTLGNFLNTFQREFHPDFQVLIRGHDILFFEERTLTISFLWEMRSVPHSSHVSSAGPRPYDLSKMHTYIMESS